MSQEGKGKRKQNRYSVAFKMKAVEENKNQAFLQNIELLWHSPKISSHSFDKELNDSILAIIYAYVFQFILLAVKIHDSSINVLPIRVPSGQHFR